jgi:Tfp pilus assembly protein PilO
MLKNLPKEKRDQLLLVAIGTVAIVLGLWLGVIKLQKRKLERIAKATIEQETKVGHAERLVKNREDIERNLDADLHTLKKIEDTMASGDMYSWIIMTVNRFRADRHVDIPQFSREVTMDVGVLPKFPYKAAQFNVRGTAYYHDLGKFIADFENAFPYIRVQNLDLEPAASSSASAASGAAAPTDSEKLAFKMEIVTLINPNPAR